jgi:NitT/TauT family transport system permease protein
MALLQTVSEVGSSRKRSVGSRLSTAWQGFIETPAWPILVAIIFVAAWEAYVWWAGVSRIILPAPSDVFRYMYVHWALLAENAWPTVYQSLIGFAVAVVGGILIAVMITQFATIRRGLYPLVVVFALIPKISVAPLLTLWFGTGDVARVALVFIIAFFPMVISPASGLMSVDRGLLMMARSFGASKSQIFWKLRVPTSIPYIFDGMKVAISLAVIGIIVAEFVTSEKGLGYLIIFATGLLNSTMMLAAVVVLSVIGLALYFMLERLEKLVVYWRTSD